MSAWDVRSESNECQILLTFSNLNSRPSSPVSPVATVTVGAVRGATAASEGGEFPWHQSSGFDVELGQSYRGMGRLT